MVKYVITAPVKNTCDGYGLHFVNGVAVTENKRIADHLKAKGYKVAKARETPPATDESSNETP